MPGASLISSPDSRPYRNIQATLGVPDYMGGGPVYKISAGMVGAGNLLMVYHAEIPTVQTQSLDSVYALAPSTDQGNSFGRKD